jgi:hypothetical protein
MTAALWACRVSGAWCVRVDIGGRPVAVMPGGATLEDALRLIEQIKAAPVCIEPKRGARLP